METWLKLELFLEFYLFLKTTNQTGSRMYRNAGTTSAWLKRSAGAAGWQAGDGEARYASPAIAHGAIISRRAAAVAGRRTSRPEPLSGPPSDGPLYKLRKICF